MSETDSQSEPSMDEILASIRRIIADEETEDPAPAAVTSPAVSPPAAPVAAEAEAPAPEASNLPDSAVKMPALSSAASPTKTEDEEILDLTRMVTDEGQIVDIGEQRSPAPVRAAIPEETADADPEPAPEPQASSAAPVARPAAPLDALISARAAEQATSSLAAVVQTAGSQRILSGTPTSSSKAIEDLVQAALTPLLKAWLDENLPPVVERVAREEIQKLVSRVQGS